MSLKLVPFSGSWIASDRIDVHAIYRRPRFREDEYGEWQRDYGTDGLPRWDLTGPLPVKQHNKWTSKGYEYVTLANRDSLRVAGQAGTIQGDWRSYDQHQTGGPWNYKKYIQGIDTVVNAEATQLRDDVLKYGPDAVQEIRRNHGEPDFTVPEALRALWAQQEKAKEDVVRTHRASPDMPVGKRTPEAVEAK